MQEVPVKGRSMDPLIGGGGGGRVRARAREPGSQGAREPGSQGVREPGSQGARESYRVTIGSGESAPPVRPPPGASGAPGAPGGPWSL